MPLVTIDIEACARCQGRHARLVFRPFTRPVCDEAGHVCLTYFGTCPALDEPLLLAINDDAGEDAST